MPRYKPRAVTAVPPPVHNALTAAAQPVMGSSGGQARPHKHRGAEGWQNTAWDHYRTCGELRYAANWFANALSRAKLYAVDAKGERQTSGPGYEAMQAFYGGPDAQSTFLKLSGIHSTVAGEFFLSWRKTKVVDAEDNEEEMEVWEVLSSKEVEAFGTSGWKIKMEDGELSEDVEEDDMLIRIFRPMPDNRFKPDSPVRSALNTLAQIDVMDQHIMSQATSRLTSAGILFLSSKLQMVIPPDAPEGTTSAHQFQAMLGGVAAEALADPSSPSARIPIVITMDAEDIDKQELMTFWSPFDEQSVLLRTEAIRRLALALDMPSEVLTGTADMNHWGAWQMEESSIKAHIEPVLDFIAEGITQEYLGRVAPGYTVAYDTTELRLRPNRSKEALELYNLGQLSAEALLRETGFAITDAMDDEERKIWLLRKIAGGSATPDQVAAALAILGIDGIPGDESQKPRETRPDPSLEDHPVHEVPEQEAAALIAACDALVFRTLERAGNRLRTISHSRPPVPADQTHLQVAAKPSSLDRLLDGAWECLPRVLDGYDVDLGVVEATLDAYVRGCITQQAEHSRPRLARALTMKVAS